MTTRVILYRDMNSLTLYVPYSTRPVNLRGLVFQVAVDVNTRASYSLERNYPVFWGMPFDTLQTPVCFRLVRQRAQSPLPLECQANNAQLLTQELTDADAFWYDSTYQIDRLILVFKGVVYSTCPGSNAQCFMSFIEEVPTPTDIPTTIPGTSVPSPEITLTPSSTPTQLLISVQNISTPDFDPALNASATPETKTMYASANAIIRECVATGCTRVGSVISGESIETIGTREGETAYGRNLWYIVEYEGKTAYIHSSVLSDKAQTPQPPLPPPPTSNVISATRPVSTGVCQRSGISGNASGLFDFNGRRRTAVQGNQGATITVELSVSNGQGDWGVRASLLDSNGNELNYRELWDELEYPSTSFAYVLPYTGTYYVEVRGDSQHTYSYRVTWGC